MRPHRVPGRPAHPSRAVLLVLPALAACASHVPRGAATEVRLENAQYRPPKVMAFVTPEHPLFPEDRLPPGYKVLPPEIMDQLLDDLEARGLLDEGQKAAGLPAVEGLGILRRLSVRAGDEVLVVIVPRRPDPALAESFNELSQVISSYFNRSSYLRYEPDLRDPRYFEKERERVGGGSGRPPGPRS